MSCLGFDREADKRVYIDDKLRQSGMYVLGKPGMGKSNFLLSLVFDDHYSLSSTFNGLFFLDPHGDAIDDILKYAHFYFAGIPRNYYLLNPENDHYSFGINPLYCRDLTSLKERTDTSPLKVDTSH